MTISDENTGGKVYFGRIPADLVILVVLLLSVTLAFGLGILAGRDMNKAKSDDGFWIEQLPEGAVKSGGGPAAVSSAFETKKTPSAPAEPEVRTYVASKNGTKYYLPTCGTAKRIKEENKVWFGTKEEAEAAGFTPAANCPGL